MMEFQKKWEKFKFSWQGKKKFCVFQDISWDLERHKCDQYHVK